MRGADFRELLESLNGLTPRQRETLLSALEQGQEEEVHEVVAELFEDGVHCPHCGAERVIRWGQTSGLPRWRCKECRRTFTPLTGTPLARLRRRDRWADFAESLRRGETLREAAERCGIHINTAHRWRHRFLKGSAQTQARLVGIAEADETFVLRSAKGQPDLRKQWGRPARKRGSMAKRSGRSHEERIAVWIARDRGGATFAQVTERLDSASLKPLIQKAVAPDTILCTDGWSTYRAVAAQLGLRHESLSFRQGERVRGPFHVQNVNNYHSRWKGWLRRFNGVSTRYLQHYVSWFRMLDAHPQARTSRFMLHAAIAP